MKYKMCVGIYGEPTKIHLRLDCLYGKEEKNSTHVWNYEFSLDNGGEFIIPTDYFPKLTETLIKELHEEESKQ